MTGLDAQAKAVSDLDPFGDDFLEDPYQAHRELREAGCAVWLERYRVWAMARHEQVDAALRDPETYCSDRGVGLADFAREEPWRPPSLLLEADPPPNTPVRGARSRRCSHPGRSRRCARTSPLRRMRWSTGW